MKMNSWLRCSLVLLLSIASILTHPAVILPPKGQIFEGDVIVTDKLLQYAQATTSEKREVHSHIFTWIKNGNYLEIPYTINGLDSNTRNTLKLAFAAFKGQTCVRFVPRKSEDDYIEFTTGNGCASSIGRQNGAQKIFLGSGCGSLGTILHEIMHSIGFFHEQARQDRDDYVVIKYENIKPDKQGQFNSYSLEAFNEEYDMKSIMHYTSKEFSRNGLNTIESKSNPNEILGNSRYFTKTDVKQINKLYNCPARFLQLHDFVIEIYTTNEWWAGTGATVYLEIKGEGTDRSGEIKVGNNFEADSKVEKEQYFPIMVAKKVTVRHDNSGWGPGWHLGKIVVRDKTSKTVVTFSCECWIDGDNNAKTLAA